MFFITIFRLLLFPLQCREGLTMSKWLNGDDAPCTPFGVPEISVTLPALVLAAVFAIFSLVTTMLLFEVNPVSKVLPVFQPPSES